MGVRSFDNDRNSVSHSTAIFVAEPVSQGDAGLASLVGRPIAGTPGESQPAPRKTLRPPWVPWLLATLVFLLAILVAAVHALSPAVAARIGQLEWTVRTGVTRAATEAPWHAHPWLEGRYVRVRYEPGHEQGARWVQQQADEMLPRVAATMGVEVPAASAIVVVHESPAALARTFQWDPDQAPLGFYADGVIHVADPLTWAEDRRTFNQQGPVAHELAHWLLDQITRGNYPAWFTEGLAQAVDRSITGFTFGWSDPCPRVDWERLNRSFHELPTAQAYGAALCLYDRLEATDPRALPVLIARLARGHPFAASVQEAYGIDVVTLARQLP